jgi:hypothetical protein
MVYDNLKITYRYSGAGFNLVRHDVLDNITQSRNLETWASDLN